MQSIKTYISTLIWKFCAELKINIASFTSIDRYVSHIVQNVISLFFSKTKVASFSNLLEIQIWNNCFNFGILSSRRAHLVEDVVFVLWLSGKRGDTSCTQNS